MIQSAVAVAVFQNVWGQARRRRSALGSRSNNEDATAPQAKQAGVEVLAYGVEICTATGLIELVKPLKVLA